MGVISEVLDYENLGNLHWKQDYRCLMADHSSGTYLDVAFRYELMDPRLRIEFGRISDMTVPPSFHTYLKIGTGEQKTPPFTEEFSAIKFLMGKRQNASTIDLRVRGRDRFAEVGGYNMFELTDRGDQIITDLIETRDNLTHVCGLDLVDKHILHQFLHEIDYNYFSKEERNDGREMGIHINWF